jgi:hypothetical protein
MDQDKEQSQQTTSQQTTIYDTLCEVTQRTTTELSLRKHSATVQALPTRRRAPATRRVGACVIKNNRIAFTEGINEQSVLPASALGVAKGRSCT